MSTDTCEQKALQQQQAKSGCINTRVGCIILLVCTIAVISFASGTMSVSLQLWSTTGGPDAVHRSLFLCGAQPANFSSTNGATNMAAPAALPASPGPSPVATSTDSVDTGPRIRLFAGVISASKYREKRDAVRQTWGSDPRLERVVFVINRPTDPVLLDRVRDEAYQHQDIIILGHVKEDYCNITYQTLETFRTAYAYHGPVTHVLKCDDDTYVHVERLLAFLATLPMNNTWAGTINHGFMPIRDPSSKWYVSKQEWPQDHNPSIMWSNGPGYVLTADLAHYIATGTVAKCMAEPLFKLEDVSLGAWLTCLQQEKKISITQGSDGRFNINNCRPGDFISHYQTPEHMRCIFASKGACCG